MKNLVPTFDEFLNEGTTPQFKKLIKRAKQLRIETAAELNDLIMDEFDDENSPITGADYEIAKKQLKLEESVNEDKNSIKRVKDILDSEKFTSEEQNEREFDYRLEHQRITAISPEIAEDIYNVLKENGIKCKIKKAMVVFESMNEGKNWSASLSIGYLMDRITEVINDSKKTEEPTLIKAYDYLWDKLNKMNRSGDITAAEVEALFDESREGKQILSKTPEWIIDDLFLN